jgi:GT2 family glycosyltransferase
MLEADDSADAASPNAPQDRSEAVSVEGIVVSYNNKDVLEASLRSVLDFAPDPDSGIAFGLAVWDNASGDGSATMIAEKFPQSRLTACGENLGFGAAVNRLVEGSGADYILLLNPDVILTADIVSPLLETLMDDPAAIVTAPRLVEPDGALQLSARHFPSLLGELAAMVVGTKIDKLISPIFGLQKYLLEFSYPSRSARTVAADFIWATCWLIEREAALKFGPFDPRFPLYDEDLDFCVRAGQEGQKLVYVPSVTVIHIGGASSTPERKERLMYTARSRYYLVHGNLAKNLLYRFSSQVTRALKRLLNRRRAAAAE